MPLRKVVVVEKVHGLVVEGEVLMNSGDPARAAVSVGMGIVTQHAAGVSFTVDLETAEKLGRSLLKVGRELRKEDLT